MAIANRDIKHLCACHLCVCFCHCLLLLQLVSKDVFAKLRSQADQRRKQGWSQVQWEMLDEDTLSKRVKLVQAR